MIHALTVFAALYVVMGAGMSIFLIDGFMRGVHIGAARIGEDATSAKMRRAVLLAYFTGLVMIVCAWPVFFVFEVFARKERDDDG